MQFQHLVLGKAEEKLDVCLKLGESLFTFFQDGRVGAVRVPGGSMSKYCQFDVRVFKIITPDAISLSEYYYY